MYNSKMYSLGAQGSAIRELYEYGKKRKKEIGEDNVFDFSLGNPSIPSPSIVNETLIDLIKNTDPTKLHGYSSASGDDDVKRSIVEYLNKKYNTDLDYKYIYMSVGAAASLTISLKALIKPSEEVIIIAPYFPEYKVFIENADGIVKVVNSIKPSFTPDFDMLERSINNNTKCIIINSPNNPTGVVYNEEIIKKLCFILEKKQKEYNHNIYLISDEPYRELVYDDINVPFITNYYDNSIICYSFSKSLSLPGERIGYILVNNKCNNKDYIYKSILGSGRSLGFVCAPTLFQYMIPHCLGYTSDINQYKENRDLLYNKLTEYGYEVVKPDGAFYLFVKALSDDSINFSLHARDYELLLVPSDSFGCSGYVRISYCVSLDMIKRALPAFKKLIDDYKEK